LSDDDVAHRQFQVADLLVEPGGLNPLVYFRTTDASPAPDRFRSLLVENNLTSTAVVLWPNLVGSGGPMKVAPGRFRLFLLLPTDVIAIRTLVPLAPNEPGYVDLYGLGWFETPAEGATT
jgi:hypothetical protein